MRNLRGQGVFVARDEAGREIVRESFTCAHCNGVRYKPLPGEPYGFCNKCFQRVCLTCGGAERCAPFEAKIEKYEARMRFRASL